MHVVLITADHAAFGTVIWVVCIAAALIGVLALLSSRRTWDDYRKDHLLLDSDGRPAQRSQGAASLGERDAEIRQMLEARNARRVRQGQEPLDVEAEVARRLRDLADG